MKKSIRRFFCVFVFVLCSPLMASAVDMPAKPFFIDEEITYSIKQLGMKAGEATLVFQDRTEKDGKEVYLIIFTIKALNFYDEEKIYIDPQTFFPVVVERDLDIWGSKEKITEYYLPEEEKIKIVKVAGEVTTEQVIEKKGVVDNIYSFIYRYRLHGNSGDSEDMVVRLPTRDLVFQLKRELKMRIAGKKYRAEFLQSNPSKYNVWFDTSDKKFPLRIDGAVGIAGTSMRMLKHTP